MKHIQVDFFVGLFLIVLIAWAYYTYQTVANKKPDKQLSVIILGLPLTLFASNLFTHYGNEFRKKAIIATIIVYILGILLFSIA